MSKNVRLVGLTMLSIEMLGQFDVNGFLSTKGCIKILQITKSYNKALAERNVLSLDCHTVLNIGYNKACVISHKHCSRTNFCDAIKTLYKYFIWDSKRPKSSIQP